ncbi:MAG TPA: HlyD family efflux transporter periplasmic adaptor subunit, partial [Ramlibacter sp.]|nr:HlyD family efflux transporter periplasmic adaptor subunit [Ramlibacter sp.]
LEAELSLLTIRAGHPGHIADMPSDVTSGRWISPKRLMGRVVNAEQTQVRAWVSETQVRRLAVGDKVAFVPRLAEQPILRGQVVRIDTRGSRVLPHPLLDGRNGGDLAAQQNARGEWMLRETLYQVDVQVNGSAPSSVGAGRMVVPTGAWDALAAATRHSITVLVRESSF